MYTAYNKFDIFTHKYDQVFFLIKKNPPRSVTIFFLSCNLMYEFLEPIPLEHIKQDIAYKANQYATCIDTHTATHTPNWQAADIILLSVHDQRGKGTAQPSTCTYDIRHQLYQLYNWHPSIKLADIGNVITGNQLQDTYAATTAVLQECIAAGKRVVILGSSHDVTLAQYAAYSKQHTTIQATCIDATIDLSIDSPFRNHNFLLEMLTTEPNYIQQYNHLAFQSYLVHPTMMDTLDKLRFDCTRLGKLKADLAEYEPAIRNSALVSFDVSAIQHAHMPCNHLPNGLNGVEACQLAEYAGMSTALSTLGIYNYNQALDTHHIGAAQVALLVWYFVHGTHQLKQEQPITQAAYYNQYTTSFGDVAITFLQQKITNRWYMQLPNNKYIACSHNDYVLAQHNDIPERWLRAQERAL